MVVLPDRTQPALYFLGIVKLSYLLKFVNADYDMLIFPFRNHFHYVEHLFRTMSIRSYAQRDIDF